MKQLSFSNSPDNLLLDSREIAEMTGKRHDHLLRDIDVFVEVLRKSTVPKFGVSEFFIEGSYTDSTGRTLRKYDATRKGCNMIANKMTGEKGILFTAAYVTKFEEMEQFDKYGKMLPQTYKTALLALVGEVEKNEKLELENEELRKKTKYVDTILQSKGLVTTTQIAKDYGLTAPELNKILHDLGVQYLVNKQWVLYKKHADKGYTQSYSFNFKHKDGTPDVKMNTQWTQQGRLFIHEILTAKGIKANIEKEIKNFK